MALLNEFYIQLYSLRDVMENDFLGTLDKLGNKGFGYTGVEFAGFGGVSADELKRVLDDNGLKALASHTGYDRLKNALDEEIAFQKTLGIEYIICPGASMKSRAEVLNLAKEFTSFNEKITAAGMKFGYHNHAHEFVTDEGEYMLDILYDNLPCDAVMELDIYWSEYAGIDSLAFMEKHKKRLELLHVKQIDKDKNNSEVDNGLIDFKDVITKAKAMGVKHFILEQEEYEVSSISSAENAIKYILGL